MKTAAEKETGTSYILGLQDCTHVATKALNAGGLKNGECIEVTKYQGKSDIPYKTTEKNWMPASKQVAIEQKNKGVQVDNQLVPIPVKQTAGSW
jgi:hypothetical protein